MYVVCVCVVNGELQYFTNSYGILQTIPSFRAIVCDSFFLSFLFVCFQSHLHIHKNRRTFHYFFFLRKKCSTIFTGNNTKKPNNFSSSLNYRCIVDLYVYILVCTSVRCLCVGVYLTVTIMKLWFTSKYYRKSESKMVKETTT